MAQCKCKNAVFSGLFLLIFSLGAICGAFLVRLIALGESGWLVSYCTSLAEASAPTPWTVLFVVLRPVLVVLAVGMLPGGYRLLPVLVFLRGCLTAYAAAACYMTGVSPAFVIFRGLLLLPLFYYFCRWVYMMQAPGQARSYSQFM